jgi:hypothetical protein
MRISALAMGSMLFFLALAGAVAQAQDQGRDRDNRNQGQDQNSQNQYRNGQNQQGSYGGDQQRQDQPRFDDRDRQISRDWYNQHQDHRPKGLRDRDRMSPQYESQLRDGYVLDRDMRKRIHSLPRDYYRQLPPAPRGYRYVLLDGHACLIDNDYRVHDVIHFELNF